MNGDGGEVDVIIVGAGVAGSALAHTLGKVVSIFFSSCFALSHSETLLSVSLRFCDFSCICVFSFLWGRQPSGASSFFGALRILVFSSFLFVIPVVIDNKCSSSFFFFFK